MPGGETETISNPSVAEKIAYIDKTYDFGTALGFLKEGMKVARKSWNGKECIYMQDGSSVELYDLKSELQENFACVSKITKGLY